MKINRIIITAFASLCLLFSCKGEQDQMPPVVKYLDFQPQLVNAKGVSKSEFVIGDQFFVYGVTTNDDNYNIAAPNANGYVFSQVAAKGVPIMNFGKDNEGNDIWKYNDPVVWTPGKSTFFGFSPVPNHSDNFGITLNVDGFALDALPSIDFVVAGGYDLATATRDEIIASRTHNRKQVDLLAAYTPDQTGGSVTSLLFEHTLAQVTFAVKPLHVKGFIRINSVTMQNVMTSGKLNLAYNGDPNAVDFTGGWVQSSLAGEKAFSINLRHDVASLIPATPDVTYSINDADETLMMIPQSLAKIVLNVNYAYSEDGKTWPEYENGKQINIPLSKISSHWKPSKQYRYVLAISPDSNTGFDAGITEMEPETNVTTP